MPAEYAVVALPETLGLTAAADLAAQLAALQGRPLALDASRVERLGGLCAQVLLSAARTWEAAGLPLEVRRPSPHFEEAWAALGAPPLAA